jgi:uncharacterized protein YlzI (FlbEa/FlbD family)
MRNLFSRLHQLRHSTDTHGFGSGWEDTLTDNLGFYLQCDLEAASLVAKRLLGEPAIVVTEVETQYATPDGRPDLALTLSDGRLLIIENKVDAVLGPEQLQRYLRSGLVALFSRRRIAVPTGVLDHPDYLCPDRRPHYYWQDLYEWLPDGAAAPEGFGHLRDAFAAYLHALGLAPSNLPEHWQSLFRDRTQEEHRTIQRDFGRLLSPITQYIEETSGLRCTRVAHKGWQFWAAEEAWWRHGYVYPTQLAVDTLPRTLRPIFAPGGEALAVEVIYDQEDAASGIALAASLPASLRDAFGHTWHRIPPRPIGTDRLRVALATPLPAFIEGEHLSERLAAAPRTAVDVVLKRLTSNLNRG